MSLRTRIVASITAIKSAALGTSPGTRSTRIEQTTVVQLASGTGAGQASKSFRDEFTLTSGQTRTWDVTALTDEDGQAVSFSRVKAFKLEVDPSGAAAGRLAASETFNPLSDGDDVAMVELAPGDVVLVYRSQGLLVTADNKTLIVEASGGTVTATLTLIGT